MLTREEQTVIDRLKETVRKLEEDREAGRVTEEEYEAKCKLVEEAADEIEIMSSMV